MGKERSCGRKRGSGDKWGRDGINDEVQSDKVEVV